MYRETLKEVEMRVYEHINAGTSAPNNPKAK